MVYEGNAWLGYDHRFRQAVAVNPQMQWSRTDTDLWHLAFTSMVKRPRCAHCSSLTHKSAHCGWAQDSPLQHQTQAAGITPKVILNLITVAFVDSGTEIHV